MALSYETLNAYIDGLYGDGILTTQEYNDIIVYILANGEISTSARDLIQVRRGNLADLPVLAQGEIGFTLDEENMYVGGINGNVDIGNKDIINQHSAQLADIVTVNISNYPRIMEETDDTERFTRALTFLSNRGGGTLKLGLEEYSLNNITIGDNITIAGQIVKRPWTSAQVTTLKFIGNGDFITINSYYDKKSILKHLRLIPLIEDKNGTKTAIVIKSISNNWGGGAILNNIAIQSFGIGVQHYQTYMSYIVDTVIHNCGIGVSYKGVIPGVTPVNPGSTFGNVNTIDRSTIYNCNIGMELVSNKYNTFNSITIEQCIIGILTYKTTVSGVPGCDKNYFSRIWMEAITKYVVCNTSIDGSFESLGTLVEQIPTFDFCGGLSGLVSPQIPSINDNYITWNLASMSRSRNYFLDDTIDIFYNRPKDNIEAVNIGNAGIFKDLFNISNKGIVAKIGLNAYEKREEFVTTDITTQNVFINYSNIVNAARESSGLANLSSSMSLMNVTSLHNDGSVCSATFIISDFAKYSKLIPTQLGTTYQSYSLLSGGGIAITNIIGVLPANRTFNVTVTGNIIKSIVVKINYFPNGLLS